MFFKKSGKVIKKYLPYSRYYFPQIILRTPRTNWKTSLSCDAYDKYLDKLLTSGVGAYDK